LFQFHRGALQLTSKWSSTGSDRFIPDFLACLRVNVDSALRYEMIFSWVVS
jgi:hypothetical protein